MKCADVLRTLALYDVKKFVWRKSVRTLKVWTLARSDFKSLCDQNPCGCTKSGLWHCRILKSLYGENPCGCAKSGLWHCTMLKSLYGENPHGCRQSGLWHCAMLKSLYGENPYERSKSGLQKVWNLSVNKIREGVEDQPFRPASMRKRFPDIIFCAVIYTRKTHVCAILQTKILSRPLRHNLI